MALHWRHSSAGDAGWPLICLSSGVPEPPHTSASAEVRLRAVIGMAFDAYVEVDARPCIVEWSPQAERLFGWTRADAIGMPAQHIITPRHRDSYEQGLRSLLASKDGTGRFKTTALHQEGHEFVVEVTVARVPGPGGDVLAAFVRDLTERKRTEDRLREAEGGYRDIVDRIEDGYFEVDFDGVYTLVNDAFCRITGYSADELVGSDYRRFFDADHIKLLYDAFYNVYKTGEPLKALEYSLIHKNGTRRFVEESVSLKRNARGQPVAFMGIRRDCTERKLHEQETARAREDAEAANRAKGEFLANMSHEIRTPMNGIIGMTELALDTALTPHQLDCLTTVRTSAESLLTILNDILDFSKIESRKLGLESVPCSPAQVVADALKPLMLRAAEKRLELVCDVAAGVPARVMADPVRLRQIVTNLVANAVKFTERGRVSVTVREDPHEAGCSVLHFEVADTGIGIPAGKQASIFEPFSQADGSTTRRFGGTGLGLAICSTLVEMMRGHIWVVSAPGAGSTFHFTATFDLPTPPADAQAAATDADAAAPVAGLPPPRRGRVLVAEDNPVNQRVALGLLTSAGYDVTVVPNGVEALNALERDTFDVVLMDVQMPEMGGFDATAAIRARERVTGAHLRIIALTAHAMRGDRERCLAAGMDGYLSKPLDKRSLLAAVADAARDTPAA